MSAKPRPLLSWRLRPAARAALAWCGAIAYPFALFFAARGTPFDSPGLPSVSAAAVTVLSLGLLRRHPLPTLALMLLGTYVTATTSPFWQVVYLLVLANDLAVGYIVATRPRRIAVTAAVMTLGVQVAFAARLGTGTDGFTRTVVVLVLALAAAWMTGHSVRERREHAAALRSQTATQAVAAERLRIPQEPSPSDADDIERRPCPRCAAEPSDLQMSRVAFARIIGVGQVPPDRSGGVSNLPDTHIVLRGVRFAYRGGQDILTDVDIEIGPGERIAVVGASGAGKTTLALLLGGVHTPTAGTVMIGGHDTREIAPAVLREHVALVTQEDHVFVGTLADNIRLGRDGANREQVEAALRSVGGDAWLRDLPEGIDTTVGVDGYQLSPAQSQQLALARLVVKDPPVVILDESTAMVDNAQRREIDGALSDILAGRTVIAIAHRLDTAQAADRVLMMSGGRIVESGSHTELLDHGGSYAALWEVWEGRAASGGTL